MSQAPAIQLSELEKDGLNAPRVSLDRVAEFPETQALGATQYQYKYSEGPKLDALLVNKGSDTLVVSLHGALNRQRFTLPRYERLRTLTAYSVSSMYFTDPTLYLDDQLQLGWYTGWKGQDVQAHIAEWIIAAQKAVSASKVIISGSSGGGFGALQISSKIPGSLAVVFNPSVYIRGYLNNGEKGAHATERKYVTSVHPELSDLVKTNEALETNDWSTGFGSEISALKTYSRTVQNRVLFCQTPTDWHYDQHYLPFLAAAARGENLNKIRVHEYGERVGHFPPSPTEFRTALEKAFLWIGEDSPQHGANTDGEVPTFSDIFATYRKNKLEYDSVKIPVPYWAIDKLSVEEFCVTNDIPSPRVLEKWKNPAELTFDNLPNNFVLKPSNLNTSRGVMVLKRNGDAFYDYFAERELSAADIKAEQQEIFEDVARKEPHRLKRYHLIAEERLSDGDGLLEVATDFKFWIFGNEIVYIFMKEEGKHEKLRFCSYDGNFNSLPANNELTYALPGSEYISPKELSPSDKKQMTELALHVARLVGSTFVRVDLYHTAEGPKLGEITPTPASPFNGKYFKFTPEFEKFIGHKWMEAIKEYASAAKRSIQK